jgi:hypothetical protein
MLQQYVSNVLTVSILCCSTWFYVASYNFWMVHVFHTHVASACSKYFIYFQTYVAFKCFHVASVLCYSVGGKLGTSGLGVWRASGSSGQGRSGPADGGATVGAR